MYVTLAAAETGAAVGMGAGGIALVLTLLLVLGVKGKGKVRLKNNPAVVTAFLTGTAFTAAGQVWGNPARLTEQGLSGLGVGTGGTGVLGDVRIAAVAAALLVVILCWELNPRRGAAIGLTASFVWPLCGPGSVFAAPSELAAGVLMMIGGS
ncbi:hypothetical protein [Streptomyces odonnellii]|uniref:hypothetical protein n=1 Tax=Streptomyces odonnellii TaxID=1417980 RepID=UPI000625ED8C|nr:hypothetical protein [Streptomyces odonnellii]